jgi:hypothetical protein
MKRWDSAGSSGLASGLGLSGMATPRSISALDCNLINRPATRDKLSKGVGYDFARHNFASLSVQSPSERGIITYCGDDFIAVKVTGTNNRRANNKGSAKNGDWDGCYG